MRNFMQVLVVSGLIFSASVYAQSTINPPTSTQPGTSTASTSSKYPPLPPDQLTQFNDQMYTQLQIEEQRVQTLMTRVQDPTIMPMSIDKVDLEAAIMDLDVKKTLVSKFVGSPSLKSPKVRQALLQILSKNYLQESDLAALQAIVNEERPYTYP